VKPLGSDYVDGEIAGVVIAPIKAFTDQRGWLMEIYREDQLPSEVHPVMAYISQTEPGVTRGPHEHVHQTDYFVFVGPGDFELCLWDARPDSPTCGHKWVQRCGQSYPCSAIVPPGVIHGYKNVSPLPGWVFNAPNRLYAGHGKREPVDEIRHEDHAESQYRVA
jgi:dTDP-4-dehydrorhamnose 3,5-epimerase